MTPPDYTNWKKPADRSRWQRGPWDDEPDFIEFEHLGLWCFAGRGIWGTWFGYVACEASDPRITVVNDETLEAHGGLVHGWQDEDGRGVGFDCAHAGDASPEDPHVMKGDVYRDAAYVERELVNLAEQINNLPALMVL